MESFFNAARREIHFLRSSFWDRAVITWIPLILLGIIALQFSPGVMRDLPVIVADQDQTQVSRDLIAKLQAAPGLNIVAQMPEMQRAEQLIRARKAYAIIVIPEDTHLTISRGETASIVLLFNASYSTPSGTINRDVSAVVQSYGAQLAREHTASIAAPGSVRSAPITVQNTLLFNPQGSYELQLVSLIHPALLHLAFMVAITGALGRELRDGTIGPWITGSENGALAVAGKLLPYLIVFMAWAALATLYLAIMRGWPINGSLAMIMAGYLAMYLAYTGVTLLIIGVSRSMIQSLSLTGLYAGASFAFAGAIFPIESASGFAQIWSALLPYTWFSRLLTEQWVMASPLSVSWGALLMMLAFLLPGLVIGLPMYLAAANKSEIWGRR